MKAMQHTTLMLALAGALSMPSVLLAADTAKDEHSGHHPDAAPVAAAAETAAPAAANQMLSMRERMREIQQTADPEKRKALVESQMKAMEAMMNDPNRNCPMAEAKDGKGMMSGGMGMKGGKCGKGMKGGGMGMGDDMMAKRMDMMEKRMDMMQMMMRMRMRGMEGGMGMPSN